MTTNYKTLALARGIEAAFKDYLNTDSFPTAEWPRVALSMAHVIEASGAVVYDKDGTIMMDHENVRSLLEKLSELNNAVAGLVGL